jgi:Choline/Carnitine o-acyltransferase
MEDDEYSQAEAIVKEFGCEGGVGEAAQRLLEQRREDTDNWAYDYWLKVESCH